MARQRTGARARLGLLRVLATGLFLSGLCAASAATAGNDAGALPAVRVAILAEGGVSAEAVAALLEVDLSRDAGIVVLERAEVRQILAEHELSASGGVSTAAALTLGGILRCDVLATVLLPEVTGDAPRAAGAAAGRFTAFDTVTGMRLADGVIAWSADGAAEGLARDAGSMLRAALAKRGHIQDGQCRTVSVSLVSDAGLVGSQKALPQVVGPLLERYLLTASDFVILERQRLAEVNRESALTVDLRERLLASAVLLDLELAPGKNGSEVTLIAKVSDAKGSALGTVRATGLAAQPGGLVERLVAELRTTLALKPLPAPEVRASRAELRFFDGEFRRAMIVQDQDAAVRAAAAGVALAPEEKMPKIAYYFALERAAQYGFGEADVAYGYATPPDPQDVLSSPTWPAQCDRLLGYLEEAVRVREEIFKHDQTVPIETLLCEVFRSAIRLRGYMSQPQQERLAAVRRGLKALGEKMGPRTTHYADWLEVVSPDVHAWLSAAMQLPFAPDEKGQFYHPLYVLQPAFRPGAAEWSKLYTLQGLSAEDRRRLIAFYEANTAPERAAVTRFAAHVALGALPAALPDQKAELAALSAQHMREATRLLTGTAALLEDATRRAELSGTASSLGSATGVWEPVSVETLAQIGDALTAHGIGDPWPYRTLIWHYTRQDHAGAKTLADAGRPYVAKLRAMAADPRVRFDPDPARDSELRSSATQMFDWCVLPGPPAAKPWRTCRELLPALQGYLNLCATGQQGDTVFLLVSRTARASAETAKSQSPRGALVLHRVLMTEGTIAELGEFVFPEGWFPNGYTHRLFPGASAVYYPLGEQIIVFPLNGPAGTRPYSLKPSLPASNIYSVAEYQGKLYLGAGLEAEKAAMNRTSMAGFLLRCDLDGTNVEVLAASSRKDARSGLDNRDPYVVEAIVPSAAPGKLRVIGQPGIWTLDTATAALTCDVDFARDLRLEGARCCIRADGDLWVVSTREMLVWEKDAAKPVLLLANRKWKPRRELSGPPRFWTGAGIMFVESFALVGNRLYASAVMESSPDLWGWYDPADKGGVFHPLPALDNTCMPTFLAGGQHALLARTNHAVWWLDFPQESGPQ